MVSPIRARQRQPGHHFRRPQDLSRGQQKRRIGIEEKQKGKQQPVRCRRRRRRPLPRRNGVAQPDRKSILACRFRSAALNDCSTAAKLSSTFPSDFSGMLAWCCRHRAMQIECTVYLATHDGLREGSMGIEARVLPPERARHGQQWMLGAPVVCRSCSQNGIPRRQRHSQ